MSKNWFFFTASIAAIAAAAPALAQDATEGTVVDTVIVTALRKDQNIQDVPATVTAVTGQDLEDLNIFKLEDVAQLAPGLSLESNGAFGSVAQLRGVGFNSNASADPAVDVYINDTPVDANYAFQSIYDIGQIEVLRGPQGTLRGRPAPGGAITVTTRRPDLSEFGASIATSFSDQHATNVEAALNIPLIADKLALRVAGLYDDNEGNGVRSVNSNLEDFRTTKSWRASLRWAPTDNLDATLTHQYLSSDRVTLNQVEGLGAGYNGPAISGPQRLAVQEGITGGTQVSEITTLQATWTLPNHRLTYSGARQENRFSNLSDQDSFNAVTNFAPLQVVESAYDVDSHELIFSSTGEDQFIDYTIGAWYQKTKTGTTFAQASALAGAFGDPYFPSGTGAVNPAYLLPVDGSIPSKGKNKAVFANLTFHVTDSTQLSVGVRYLEDSSVRTETINTGAALIAVPLAPNFGLGSLPGVPAVFLLPADTFFPGQPAGCPGLALVSPDFTGTETYPGSCDLALTPNSVSQDGGSSERQFVYNASLSHDFSEDVMAYVSFGHSFRPAGVTVGITSAVTPDLISGESETSNSYELGFKSQWMDRRLRFNAAIYHQDFENFIGRFEDVPYNAGSSVQSGGFTYPGDAKVDGAEIELDYRVSDDWSVALSASVSDGKFDNARVPCRDSDFDGVPDNGIDPTLADFAANAPGQSVFYCVVNDSISTLPPWSMTLQSEYNFPIRTAQGYVRGLFTYYGENDNLGPAYVAESYGLLNLYVGARSDEAGWDISLWAKNVFDEETILNRGRFATFAGRLPDGVTPSFSTGYRSISYTRPREVGVTLRYAFQGG
jgi:iron complex outermembrane recepter protein